MLKKAAEILVVSLIVAGVAGVFIKLMGSIPFSVSQITTNKTSTFDASGEGKISVVPDRALVVLGVRKTAPKVKTAQDQANEMMDKVIADLKQIGVEEKDIKTTSYDIYPDYSGATGKPNGFVVSTQVQVKVRNFENIPAVLDLAGTYGLEQVGQLSFILSDELKDETMGKAREEAVKEAKKKADSLAKLAGVKLGKIVNVTEGYGGGVSPMMYNAVNRAVGAAEMKDSATVSPGMSEMTVSVTLSYETL